MVANTVEDVSTLFLIGKEMRSSVIEVSLVQEARPSSYCNWCGRKIVGRLVNLTPIQGSGGFELSFHPKCASSLMDKISLALGHTVVHVKRT